MGVWTFAWRSPAGVVHGVFPLAVRTACGIALPQGRRGWSLLARRRATCSHCEGISPA